MQLFGFNITKAAEPKTKIAGATREEIGDSGTSIIDGYITEDHNTKLQGSLGIQIFDEMRKSDGTVKAAVLATSLPIRRANWFIEQASEDTKDEEVKDFVSKCLFDLMTVTWADLLRQSLLMLPFGVMVFEKVFEVQNIEGKDYIVWRKLAPRMPKSISSWVMENGKDGVQQLTSDGNTVNIPLEKLLIFINEKEGDNWWGNSILRPAYKHWFMKDAFYKIDAIAFERQGLGVPVASLPSGYTPADEEKAKTILKNMRAHDQGYLIKPAGYEIEFMDMKGSATRDPSKSIQHHNREIVKSVLAHFLELGAGGSGSRALSTDQSDLFLQSLEAVANVVVDVFNKYAIPQLVDLNFDNIKQYPKLQYNGISRVDIEKLSKAYQQLSQSGAVEAIDADEQYFRELMSLPERDPDAEPRKKIEPKKKDKDDLDLSELKKKDQVTRQEVRETIESHVKGMTMAEQVDFIKSQLAIVSNKTGEFYRDVKAVLSERQKEIERHIFQEENDFESWRKLTFAEKKVNFGSIERNMDKIETQFLKQTNKVMSVAKEIYIAKLADLARKKDKRGIIELQMKFEAIYSKTLKDTMKGAFEYGKNNAAREMGLSAPSNPKVITDQMDIAASVIAKNQVETLTFEAKKGLLQQLEKKVPVAQAIGAIDLAVSKKIKKLAGDTSNIITGGWLNNGRNTVFEKYEAKIYALQRSEILDRKTCNYCLSMDGRIIEKTDPMAKQGIFHSRCRGIWVEILHDESEKPKISGIPNSLRDRFGDGVNELMQPKKPIVKKKSAAAKYIKKK